MDQINNLSISTFKKQSIMDKPYVVGIDMGGTNTVFGIVDARGNVVSKSAVKTATHQDINL